MVGYISNEDCPSLIFPGYLDPFNVTDPIAAVNAEAAKIRSQGKVNAIVAVGHLGRQRRHAHAPDPTGPARSTSPTSSTASTR